MSFIRQQKILVPHNPAWKQQFKLEAEQVRQICGDLILEVHHIGSTSIPGIIAKPIIDILGVFSDFKTFNTLKNRFIEEGYEWDNDVDEYPWQSRFISKPNPNKEAPPLLGNIVNLHFYPQGDSNIKRLLNFRDYLLQHPEKANLYAKEKLYYVEHDDLIFYSVNNSPLKWEAL